MRVTVGALKEQLKNLNDDLDVMFQYREGFPLDGRDLIFPVTHIILTSGIGSSEPNGLLLSGVIPPEEIGEEV